MSVAMHYKYWIVYFIVAVMLTVLGWVIAAHAQTQLSGSRRGTVNVTSSTQAVQVTDRIKMNLRVGVPSTAATSVCIVLLDSGTPCSTITSPSLGLCIPAGHGYEWATNIYRWEGQACAILELGSTPVSLTWSDP